MGAAKAQFPRSWRTLPRATAPFDVVGVGENSVDVVATVPHWPARDGKVELRSLVTLPGGQAATAMVGCARLGLRAQYLGVFGDDQFGKLAEEALRAEGVDTSACHRVAASNRSAVVVVDGSQDTRAVLWRRDRALNWPDISEFARHVEHARVLLVDATDLDAAVAAATAARSAQIPVVVDIDHDEPGVDRLLRQVNVLIASEKFPQEHTGAASLSEALRALGREYGADAAIATLGAAGALGWDVATEFHSPGFVVPVVDSTGAGDAFRAGFIVAWLQQRDDGSLQALLDFANATAALNCRASGAQAGLPSKAEVLGLLTDPSVRRSKQTGFKTEVSHP